jgi:hypothetical protein
VGEGEVAHVRRGKVEVLQQASGQPLGAAWRFEIFKPEHEQLCLVEMVEVPPDLFPIQASF